MVQPSKRPSNLTETADNSTVAMHENAREIEEKTTLRAPHIRIVMRMDSLANSGESFSPAANQAFGDFISVTLPISINLAPLQGSRN